MSVGVWSIAQVVWQQHKYNYLCVVIITDFLGGAKSLFGAELAALHTHAAFPKYSLSPGAESGVDL